MLIYLLLINAAGFAVMLTDKHRAKKKLWRIPEKTLLLTAVLGGSIGSDVPFCTLCGTAMAEGRGERLRKLPDMPDCVFVVCKPDFSASSPELYRKLDENEIAKHPDHQAMESALLAGDLLKVAQNVYNVFDPVVTAEHLELNLLGKRA